MKTLSFTIILFILHYKVIAQPISFTDTTNEWKVLQSMVEMGPNIDYKLFTYKYATGTINRKGYEYSLLYGDNQDTALIRQAGDKVYAIVLHNRYFGSDTTEYLLYDFDAKAGDTIHAGKQTYYVIEIIDTVKVGNLDRKIFYVTSYFSDHTVSGNSYIIDQIGCLKDPLFPYQGFYFEENRDLKCFSNRFGNLPVIYKDTTNYYPLFNNTTSCKDTSLGLFVHDITSVKSVSIYPQPASGTVTFKFPDQLRQGTVSLYNIQGQLIKHISFSQKQQLEIHKPNNTNTLYFYKITDPERNTSYSGKVIFE